MGWGGVRVATLNKPGRPMMDKSDIGAEIRKQSDKVELRGTEHQVLKSKCDGPRLVSHV